MLRVVIVMPSYTTDLDMHDQKPSQVPLLCFLVVLQSLNPLHNPYITSGKSLFEKKEIFIDFSHASEPYAQRMSRQRMTSMVNLSLL